MSWLRLQPSESIFISAISLGELQRGVTLLMPSGGRRAHLEQMIQQILPLWFESRVMPVDRSIAERGDLDARRQLAGRPLNTGDGLIAATALEHGLTVVTRNVQDFAGLGVPVFNPWECQG